MAEARVTVEPLFVACTRPAMILGAPIEAVGVNIIVSGVIFLVGGNLLYLASAPVIHAVCRAICRLDHNAFRLLFAYLDTKGRARNSDLWGGSSASPLRVHRRLGSLETGHG